MWSQASLPANRYGPLPQEILDVPSSPSPQGRGDRYSKKTQSLGHLTRFVKIVPRFANHCPSLWGVYQNTTLSRCQHRDILAALRPQEAIYANKNRVKWLPSFFCMLERRQYIQLLQKICVSLCVCVQASQVFSCMYDGTSHRVSWQEFAVNPLIKVVSAVVDTRFCHLH